MFRRRLLLGWVGAPAAAILAIGLVSAPVLPASGSGSSAQPGPTTVEPFTEQVNGLADLDVRGQVLPSTTQLNAVPTGARVRWNRYGTPSSMIAASGYLSGPSAASAASAARSWLSSHATALGLTATQIDALRVISDSQLVGSQAHVVLFRQYFGGLPAAVDGMVTVGVAPAGQVAYVSSSLAKTSAVPASGQQISPLQAWAKAAANVGESTAGALDAQSFQENDWTTFKVPGYAQVQRVRLRALALPDGAVRPVYEANVVDAAAGSAVAYTSFVDAITGQVLIRHNQVDNLTGADPNTTLAEPFQGSFTATDCGPEHPYQVDSATKTIVVSASAVAPDEDIVLNLLYNGNIVASSDTATSPEAIVYSIPDGQYGTYSAQVCPFANPTAPVVVGQYVGVFIASEQDAPNVQLPYPPKWKHFVANPELDGPATNDTRQVACWIIEGTDCDVPISPLNNLAARAPWDQGAQTSIPTFTTIGNAASTAEAWLSPLTPGGLHQQPISPNRHYGYDNPMQDFTDAWNNSKCDPTQLVPGGNDILASVTNLFAGHNRMHDFSYFLGFTEGNYNLQDSNFGQTDPGRAHDPEVGNVQAGAIDGGYPSYLGRDNANQITLQDGVPGITNQYLFQPIAGAFYAPCADGDFDAPVYAHEYTHAISNRMVAGPDAGIVGFQAGSMGEAWSDQVALEYLFEHSYDTGGDTPWVEGPYVTGNTATGIRNYALDSNPLQYGDLGYDVTGPEVHADGEVWNAAMFDVRRELVQKYNARFPENDQALQLRCSDGAVGPTQNQLREPPLPADQCPGGRRWIQLMFDSFLLQQSATSMLDARDAYLAADLMRFGGANKKVIWRGFASDGLGVNASTTSTEDDQPIAGYVSPTEKEGTLKVTTHANTATGRRVIGELYVGRYEARVTPIADTDPGTPLGAKVKMVPGTYQFVFRANGYGLTRFTETVTAGTVTTHNLILATNWASIHKGATVLGGSPGLNSTKLIDDTEATNWAGLSPGVSVDVSQPFVTVKLAGRHTVGSVRVSAMLRPANPAQDEDPNQPDKQSGSRFTALRQFAIEVCNQSVTSDCSTNLPSGAGSPYQRIYTSPADAFNGVAPRPLAPDLLLKTFDVTDTVATHVRIVVLQNQCTGQSQYAGEQDNDPLNVTDCKLGSTRDESVRAAELEVFAN